MLNCHAGTVDSTGMKMPLVKTPLGLQVMKTRNIKLSFGQRQALVLLDGTRSTRGVLGMLSHLGLTPDEVQQMVNMGLLKSPTPAWWDTKAPAAEPTQAAEPSEPPERAKARYAEAYPVAVQLTSQLGLRGFRLNLAVEFARDIQGLQRLGPRILKAVGEEAYAPLARLLGWTQ